MERSFSFTVPIGQAWYDDLVRAKEQEEMIAAVLLELRRENKAKLTTRISIEGGKVLWEKPGESTNDRRRKV